MKLSIVTINYNNAEGLRKTLASVASQTYADIEHIIVDGGSTDGSVEIIRQYADNEAIRLEGYKAIRLESSEDNDNVPNRPIAQSPDRHEIRWISEPDKGIYNAMNKGIEIALGKRVVNSLNRSELVDDKNKGIEIALGKRVVNEDHTSSPIALSPHRLSDYIQILNSGDILAASDVTERMMAALKENVKQQHQQQNTNNHSVMERTFLDRSSDARKEHTITANENTASSPHRLIASSPIQNCPAIFYGNMIKVNAAGKVVGKSGYTEYSLRQFYSSTLNHDCAYIRRDLFEEYGLYDEQLKIVSDWKWYLQAIGLGRVKPEYVDIDVTIFDDGGISETNLTLRNAERRKVLEEVMPPAALWDYDTHAFEMEQMKRLRKWHLYGLVYFIERVCFKLEKWFCRR